MFATIVIALGILLVAGIIFDLLSTLKDALPGLAHIEVVHPRMRPPTPELFKQKLLPSS
jgi:hypothetical protein